MIATGLKYGKKTTQCISLTSYVNIIQYIKRNAIFRKTSSQINEKQIFVSNELWILEVMK